MPQQAGCMKVWSPHMLCHHIWDFLDTTFYERRDGQGSPIAWACCSQYKMVTGDIWSLPNKAAEHQWPEFEDQQCHFDYYWEHDMDGHTRVQNWSFYMQQMVYIFTVVK